MKTCFTILCVLIFVTCAFGQSVILASNVNGRDIETGLLLARSFWSTFEGAGEVHLCISSVIDDWKSVEDRAAIVGVHIHKLINAKNKTSIEWQNILCLNQIGHYLFMNDVTDANVLFIASTFLITGDITDLIPAMNNIDRYSTVWCVPKLITHYTNLNRTNNGMCEMDIMLISSGIATEMYGIVNATMGLDIPAEEVWDICIRSLSLELHYFPWHLDVVRAGRVWNSHIPATEVRLIEFDQINHKLSIIWENSQCLMNLFIEWPKEFYTADVIVQTLEPLTNNVLLSDMILGCADDKLHELIEEKRRLHTSKAHDNSNVELNNIPKYKPLVFDTFMINDELALLQLRLEFLKEDVVDAHIIVESKQTFTGKSKPLHYLQNSHLFEAYKHRIIHVALDNLYIHNVTTSFEVWQNEYYSRNIIANVLESDNVMANENDIILLNDVDEIPHPDSVAILRNLHSHWSQLAALQLHYQKQQQPVRSSKFAVRIGTQYMKIHRLQQLNFMYDFNCLMKMHTNNSNNKSNSYHEALLSGGTAVATTIKIAKQLQQNMFPNTITNGVINQKEHYISLTRMFMQSAAQPYPFQHVLSPGGWHLTFFGGINKIKNKLLSYSHQNFVRQFMDNDDTTTTMIVDHNNKSTTTDVLNISGFIIPAYGAPITNEKGYEVFPKELPKGEISVSRIEAKIAAGLEIDNRNRRICNRIVNDNEYDEYALKLKSMWSDILLLEAFT